MQYRKDKYGNPISVLGYGCMRFTTKAGRIDLDKAEKEIMAAIAGGVNYFDTAYVYSGSEAALGEILKRNNARDKINIATKLPHYLVKNTPPAENIKIRVFNISKNQLFRTLKKFRGSSRARMISPSYSPVSALTMPPVVALVYS